MKLLLFFLPLALWGQVNASLACSNTIRGGANLPCTISISGTASIAGGLGAWQGNLQASSPVGQLIVSALGTAAAAQKGTQCNASGTCLLFGINSTAIADGQIIQALVPIPASLGGQTIVLTLTSTLGASVSGTAVNITPNPLVSVSVLSACDVNGDGQFSVGDVTTEANLVLSGLPGDLNSDSASNVVDVQIVVRAALGLGCVAQ